MEKTDLDGNYEIEMVREERNFVEFDFGSDGGSKEEIQMHQDLRID